LFKILKPKKIERLFNKFMNDVRGYKNCIIVGCSPQILLILQYRSVNYYITGNEIITMRTNGCHCGIGAHHAIARFILNVTLIVSHINYLLIRSTFEKLSVILHIVTYI